MNDYIMLPRSTLTTDLLKDANLCKLYLNLLARSDDDGKVQISIRKLSKELRLPYQQLRTMLHRLAQANVLEQESATHLTQITLCKSEIKPTLLTQLPTQKPIHSKRKVFIPPTEEEVTAYVNEKGYRINPATFVSFYQSKGWKVGNQPMKDWRAAARQWELRNKQRYDNGHNTQTDQYSALEQAAEQILRSSANIFATGND